VKRASIYFGDVDKPVELSVGTPERAIKYFPRGKALEVPEFAPGDASACDAILGPVTR
jgi:hypothetical protein